jgi:peptidoglycan/LPS O-acetylase OafA/YrhL
MHGNSIRDTKVANGASMKISDETSQKIKNMSLLCAVLVVSIHVGWPHEPTLSVGWFMGEIVNRYAVIAVPFFFVVSGFFLAQHFDETGWWKREVGKRIKSLLIPFFAWSLITSVSGILLSVVPDLIAKRPLGTNITWTGGNYWLQVIGLDFTKVPVLGPLWYVRCLMIFVLFGVVFDICVRKLKYVWIVFAYALYILQHRIPCDILRDIVTMGMAMGGVPTGIFYFSCGVFIHRFKLRHTSTPVAALCGTVGLCLLGTRIVFAFNGCRGQLILGTLSIPPLAYFTWHFMTCKRIPVWLTSCSFPIFLMHPIWLSYLGIAMKHVPIGKTVAAFVAFGGSIATSIAAAVILRRFFPRFANVVFGGR